MKKKALYRPLEWLMVRTPLLPVEDYLALRDGWPMDTAPGTLAPADPRIHRALAVGGGELPRALEKPARDNKSRRKLAGKLLRYLIRMSTRPTPYGTFAGVGLASWGEHTNLELAANSQRTRTRPDMAWLMGLVAELEQRPEVRAGLRWLANPAALVHAGRVFLAERVYGGEPVSLRATAPVREALRIARTPVAYHRLRDALTESSGATAAKVERLLGQLWEQSVLLTDLRPPMTVAEPARYVAERLAAIPAARAEAEALSQLLDAMNEWDQLAIEHAAANYPKLVAQAKAVRPEDEPLQVDMAVTLSGAVGRAIAAEATRAGELLLRLSPMPRGPSSLSSYRRAFAARYGADREVPLLELVDPDTGLGLPGHAYASPTASQTQRHRTLRNLVLGAIRDHQMSVELDEKTLSLLETWPVDAASAPVSLDISVFVVAGSPEAIDAGDFQVVIGPNLGASAAGRNLGRFADMLDASAALSDAAKAEADVWPGQLAVEVVYLPKRSRSANVVIRPLVRENQVVLDTTPGERTIPLDELTVYLRDGRFVVRWPARDVDVMPCAGHMLNPRQAPPVVRFLDEVARDGRPQLSGFDWGPAAEFPFTPRVCAGRVVLAPATWRIGADTTIAEWAVPRHVYLAVGDNRLLLDLHSPAQRDQLDSEIRRLSPGERLILQEALPSPETAWLPGPGNAHYITEFVVPMVLREKQPTPEKTVPRAKPGPTPPRVCPPGSEWLFAKLYHLPAFENDLIAGELRDFCAQVLADSLADDWFFIRYADPEQHLRIRFRGDPDRLATTLAPRLYRWAAGLIDTQHARRLCVDTYVPEVERYGGPTGLTISEELFGVDSRAVADLLHANQLEPTLLAARTVDDLLAALGFDEAMRIEWYREYVPNRRPTSDDYRRRQADLRNVLSAREFAPAAVVAILENRHAAIEPLAARFDELADRGELWQPKLRLAHSLVHLHCNRLLGTGSPTEQHVLGLLLRTRESLLHAPVRP